MVPTATATPLSPRSAAFGMMMALVLASGLVLSGTARAADPIEIHISDHRFHPDVVEVPAGQKTKLIIFNDGDDVEEFESSDLNREKIIRPGRKITIFLPPLKPGEYAFFGEFHPETAQGKVVVK
ncbi:MAG: cupredoxin domain-containing protein [Leptospirillia bacterium]